MRAERGDPSVWKDVYEQKKKIAPEFEIEPSVAKQSEKKNNRKAATHGECPSHKPRDLLARAVYLPLIDHLIQEINDRLLSQEDRFLGQ